MNFNLTLHPALYFAVVCGCILLLPALVFRSTRIPSRRMRWVLFGMRAAGLVILLLILADPVSQESEKHTLVRDKHLFLVDTSASMSIGHPTTRLEQVHQTLNGILSDASLADHVRCVHFDSELHLREAGGPSAPATARGESTCLGRSLADLIEATQDVGVANIVVCSDGRLHDRERLGEAVRLAKRHGVPVSALAVGDDRPPLNLAIRNCLVERHAPPGTRLPVRVLIRSEGASDRDVQLKLKGESGRILAEETFAATEGLTERELLLTVGARSESYSVALSELLGEVTFEDNAFGFKIDVFDPVIKVLYMEGSNHKDVVWGKWEYEYLKEAFLEAGNVEVDVFTVDKQVAQGGKLYNVAAPARGYPATREKLFGYDLVICSDVNRFIFSAEQLQWTAELVAERGAGFCMIGGYTAFGAGGWDKTAWEQMIPMDMKTLKEGYVSEEFKPQIPPEARKHAIMQLDTNPDRNDRILDAHPAFKGTNLVNRAKPGATTLALYGERKTPVISVQSYGKGRSMAFTSDAAGGWGDYYQTQWGEGEKDNRYYRRFWANSLKWLTENSLARRRTELIGNTEAVTYKPGQTVKLRAQMMKPAARPDDRPATVKARFDWLEGESAELRWDANNRQYRGELQLPEKLEEPEVAITFTAADAEGHTVAEDRVAIRILRIKKEFVEVRPDRELLAELARVTGGAFLRGESDLKPMLENTIRAQKERLRHFKVPLWDRTWLWCILIVLLSAEWLIRKIIRFA